MTDAQLQAYLHDRIPITRAMGFTIAGSGPDRISIAVPLSLNGNHQGTAFGGSISAALTTAAWACVHIAAGALDPGAIVVVRDGTTHYDLPLHTDFIAEAEYLSEHERHRLQNRYERSGRVKVRHNARILHDGQVAASFAGSFVILAASSQTLAY